MSLRTDAASVIARGRVPREPFRGIVLAMMVSQGYDVEAKETEGLQSVRRLAELADVSPRRLYEILDNTFASYSFDLCDKLLCVLDGPTAWHDYPELRDIYDALNLVHIDVDEAVADAMYAGKSWEQL